MARTSFLVFAVLWWLIIPPPGSYLVLGTILIIQDVLETFGIIRT